MGNPVRIGRVRLKSGGEVRLLPNPAPETPCVQEARTWLASVAEYGDLQPDAVLCIAWAWDGDTWRGCACWRSESAALPQKLLPAMAYEYVSSFMTENAVERRIMRNLGYRPVDPA
jgi:hypothetical protein